MTKIDDVEGIGPAYAAKLVAADVKTVEHLLEVGATPKGRKDLAAKTGISDTMLLKWINRADLSRLKGVGSEYADLLEIAGVDTIPELSNRKPDNLLAKMTEVNESKKLVRKLPTLTQVEDWVKQAKALPKVITY
jgi:predicted flap endonuclease-1-like 5' DNA nuclease